MSWFSKRWVPRWKYDAVKAANRSVQEERDKIRQRQDGYDTLTSLMKHLGIIGVQAIAGFSGEHQFLVEYKDGIIKPIGSTIVRRWPS
jgi:hypothetical protein